MTQQGTRSLRFVFDLDGTLTRAETLPFIAAHFGLQAQIDDLTRATVAGEVAFEDGFAARVAALGHLSVREVATLLRDVPVFEGLAAFIRGHARSCVIATGNLECWVAGLRDVFGCKMHMSEAELAKDRVIGIRRLVDKQAIVQHLQAAGHSVIFIGDGANDVAAMRVADVGIAAGLVHAPARGLLDICDHLVTEEAALLTLLDELIKRQHPS
ncbi:HAD superfamily phosphoserine phosphatase-like hydrolase [Rubricella aquisinus]|uniref:phosphoserine phosphatase n=1 Tax=Rubricella aquisinus TaxID=2028108 RepID=A0A840WP99_9RHOB|nr:HAD-IB family phosphatase [Rubricella aquisinus]MBB5516461.1 HAD superfamily phosphoserine phosphatase-like hydrolase [Rubricella aquisinus]